MNNTTNKVELIGHYGGDTTHAMSAWTSTTRDYDTKKERMPGLLKTLAENGHHTPFEKSSLHFLVDTDIATHIHLIKHRVGVSCVTGDTEIHIAKYSGGVQKRKIADMYQEQEQGIISRSKNSKVYRRKDPRKVQIRAFDPDTNLICKSPIQQVFYNGSKEVYRFTLADGRYIDCTNDHRLYIKNVGWLAIGEAVGLEVRNGVAGMTIPDVSVAVNGVMERPWVSRSFFKDVEDKMTRKQAAKHLGMTYENLKKWGYVHGIQFLPDENKDFKKGNIPWNNRFTGYKAPRAKKIWNIPAEPTKYKTERVWRAAVGNWTRQQLPMLMKKYNYVCQGLATQHSRNFECHHLVPVQVDPSKACDFDNLILMCSDCHKQVHKTIEATAAFEAEVRSRTAPIQMSYLKPRKGRRLQAHYMQVIKVEALGVQDVYDLEVTDVHNYVANGIILHNCNAESARYKELKEDKFYLPQDWQGIDMDEDTDWYQHLLWFTELSNKLYHRALQDLTPVLGRKRAKESARFFKTYNSQIASDVMFNFRSFIHFQKLRNDEHAQVEVREVAQLMLGLVQQLPDNPFEHSLKAFGYGPK